jgi:hypothetical protein
MGVGMKHWAREQVVNNCLREGGMKEEEGEQNPLLAE